MEPLNIALNKPEEFDQVVHGTPDLPSLPQASTVQLITKDRATESGRAGVVITFLVAVDGKPMRAQATVSVRNLVAALTVLDARYEDGFARVPNA